MRKLFLASIFTFAMAGCATQQINHNYAAELPEITRNAIALDAAQQLTQVFQPNASTLSVAESTDGFGQALSEALAQSGFKSAIETSEGVIIGTPVNYILDTADSNIYRISLEIDGVKLSRAYIITAGQPIAAGAWSKIGE